MASPSLEILKSSAGYCHEQLAAADSADSQEEVVELDYGEKESSLKER